MALVFVGLGLIIRKEGIPQSVLAIFSASGFILAYSLVLFFFLTDRRYSRVIKYISVSVDVAVLSVVLYSFSAFRTFKTPAFLVYFIVITLAAMRFSGRLTALGGALSIGCYGVVIAVPLVLGAVDMGTIQESFTTPKVSIVSTICRIVLLAAFAGVQIYIAERYRFLVRRAVDRELELEKQREDKQRVIDTFSRYVTQQVAQKILSEGINLRGEKRTATILFCDIRDFTRLSDGMTVEEVVGFLNDYFSRMIDVVFEHGGTLDKFIGDAIMAVFGAPFTSGRDEEMAVRSAIRVKDVLREINEQRIASDKEPVRIGIGIHTGEVIAGNIGSDKRMEYTAIGRTVNIASRIEALNKEFMTDILISQNTLERLQGTVEVEKQKAAKIRGVDSPVQTYRVVSMSA
jgi:class 3 adenylate cyclase